MTEKKESLRPPRSHHVPAFKRSTEKKKEALERPKPSSEGAKISVPTVSHHLVKKNPQKNPHDRPERRGKNLPQRVLILLAEPIVKIKRRQPR